MTARYFSAEPIQGDHIVLGGDEAHHVLHVMRAGEGDRVTLFDGSGWEFAAEVVSCQRRTVELTIHQRREVSRELAVRVVVGVSLPKGYRQKWLVEKLTELGVAELIPLQSERSVAQPGTAAVERLRRSVIEASKQCGRNKLMQISSPRSFADYVQATGQTNRSLLLLADPSGQSLGQLELPRAGEVHCAIGPEGGFSEVELTIAKAANWTAVSLGPSILRIETAAIALAARIAMA